MCRPGAGLWLSEAIGDACHGEHFISSGSLTKYNLDCYSDSELKGNSITMNMAMRHSHENERISMNLSDQFLWKHHFWKPTYWLIFQNTTEPKSLI